MSEQKKPKPKTRYELTSGSAAYLLVAALMLSVAWYFQTNPLFAAFGLMVGGAIVSCILSWLMMRKINVERVIPPHGVAGEAMMIRYRVHNAKAWTPVFGLVVREGWGTGKKGHLEAGPIADSPQRLRGCPTGWLLHLGPAGTGHAEAPAWPLRRGVLKFEKIRVSTTFPFGILRRVMEVEAPAESLVYPHLYRINRRLLHSMAEMDPQGKKRLERPGGSEEFFGLRAYRPGDSLKTIDWKRTAKIGSLITREMTQPSPPRIMVALDLRNIENLDIDGSEEKPQRRRRRQKASTVDPRQAAIERAVSLTASVICDAYFNGFQVGLVVFGIAIIPFPVHHSLPHRTKILEALSRLDLDMRTDEPPMLPARPSVVICPGKASATRVQGATHLGTSDMSSYVVDADEGASTLLGQRHLRRVSQRMAVKGGDAWQ